MEEESLYLVYYTDFYLKMNEIKSIPLVRCLMQQYTCL